MSKKAAPAPAAEPKTELTREQLEAAAAAAKEAAQEAIKKAQTKVQEAYDRAVAFSMEMGVKNPRSVFVPVEIGVFLNLRNFPFNRDVVKRNNVKANYHLKGALVSEQQAKVAIVLTSETNCADFWNEEQPFMILDGHSRKYAWLNNKLAQPEFVTLEIFLPMSDEQIDLEYEIFTNSKAQATAGEKVDHSNKKAHYDPQSGFCKTSWKNAIALLGAREYDAGLAMYREALDLVDSWKVEPERGSRRYVSGVKAAILETFKNAQEEVYGTPEAWEKFWLDFFSLKEDSVSFEQGKKLLKFCKNNTGSGAKLDTIIKGEAVKQFQLFAKAEAKAGK